MTPRLMFAAIVVTLCAPTALIAADGVLIVQQVTSGANTQTSSVQIEKERMRAEVGGPAGQKMATIFDGPKQVMWIVNYDAKSYNEMTKADVDRMAGQMSAAMAQMQEQMKNLPPAQRAQMEAMMRGRGFPGRGAAPARTEYRKTGTGQVGRWTCDKYEGFRDAQKVSELCTVDPKELGLTPQDFAVSQQLMTFLQALMPQNADMMFRLGSPEQGFSGVPVRTVTTMGGSAQVVSEIKQVTRQAFPDSTFAVPSDFQKQQLIPGR